MMSSVGEAAQFSFLRSFRIISRSSFAYSSMIRRSSCERESLASGTFLLGSGRSIAFMVNGSSDNQKGPLS
jgi:hypothetical protein